MDHKNRLGWGPSQYRSVGSDTGSTLNHVLVISTHFALLLLLYLQTYDFDYVYFDDYEYVVGNSVVSSGLSIDGLRWAFTTFHQSNWHPVTWLSHMLDVSLFGVDPGWPHLINAALHGLNSLLVYVLLIRISGSWHKAFILSLVFLVHPLHVESVAWLAERKDLLSALFFLLGLLLYGNYRDRPDKVRYAAVVCAHGFALMSKPMAVTFPVVLLILDYFVYHQSFRGVRQPTQTQGFNYAQALVEKLPLILMSAASCLVTVAAQDSGHALADMEKYSLETRWSNATTAYFIYVRQFFVPVDLAAFYPLTQSTSLISLLVPGISLLVITILSTVAISSFPLIPAGLYFYLVTLLPVIGLVQVGEQAHADRYMYLPLIGLLMMGIHLLPSIGDKRYPVANLLSAVFILYLATLSYWQISHWENRHALFNRVLAVNGPNFRAYIHLGGFYLDKGMPDQARQHGLNAMKLKPDSPLPYRLFGHIALAEERFSTAEKLYQTALLKGDYSAELHNNLAIALAEQGRISEANAFLEKALQINPTMIEARRNMQRYNTKREQDRLR